ncbi:hypothetical protein BAUCODRAFT_367159 [Baudoinia panamericana UAMH 10762]|uniref:Flavin reductase like domain-containing protein n=1 Tax=Baudoinia panamericana (strain UAMH 10762) TaxID=717646 RepID=M2NLX5_BAUPA|nr:uncharacterized protein BAUCODRAFT_367159 [Baudoinia panamericana UAMH 10762]EMD00171.1 hypothetical protein BAUCODRAFT_367159 [Baudoinia panamericana UAMH 10762]
MSRPNAATRRFYAAFYEWSQLFSPCLAHNGSLLSHSRALSASTRLRQSVEGRRPLVRKHGRGVTIRRTSVPPAANSHDNVFDGLPELREPDGDRSTFQNGWRRMEVRDSTSLPSARPEAWHGAVRYRSNNGMMLEMALPPAALAALQSAYGDNLKRLKEETGARVEIGSVLTRDDGQTVKSVLISGTYDQVAVVKRVLKGLRYDTITNRTPIGRDMSDFDTGERHENARQAISLNVKPSEVSGLPYKLSIIKARKYPVRESRSFRVPIEAQLGALPATEQEGSPTFARSSSTTRPEVPEPSSSTPQASKRAVFGGNVKNIVSEVAVPPDTVQPLEPERGNDVANATGTIAARSQVLQDIDTNSNEAPHHAAAADLHVSIDEAFRTNVQDIAPSQAKGELISNSHWDPTTDWPHSALQRTSRETILGQDHGHCTDDGHEMSPIITPETSAHGDEARASVHACLEAISPRREGFIADSRAMMASRSFSTLTATSASTSEVDATSSLPQLTKVASRVVRRVKTDGSGPFDVGSISDAPVNSSRSDVLSGAFIPRGQQVHKWWPYSAPVDIARGMKGTVLGRRGMTRQWIEALSGAKLGVQSSNQRDDGLKLLMVGTPEAADLAVKLAEEVRSFAKRMNHREAAVRARDGGGLARYQHFYEAEVEILPDTSENRRHEVAERLRRPLGGVLRRITYRTDVYFWRSDKLEELQSSEGTDDDALADVAGSHTAGRYWLSDPNREAVLKAVEMMREKICEQLPPNNGLEAVKILGQAEGPRSDRKLVAGGDVRVGPRGFRPALSSALGAVLSPVQSSKFVYNYSTHASAESGTAAGVVRYHGDGLRRQRRGSSHGSPESFPGPAKDIERTGGMSSDVLNSEKRQTSPPANDKHIRGHSGSFKSLVTKPPHDLSRGSGPQVAVQLPSLQQSNDEGHHFLDDALGWKESGAAAQELSSSVDGLSMKTFIELPNDLKNYFEGAGNKLRRWIESYAGVRVRTKVADQAGLRVIHVSGKPDAVITAAQLVNEVVTFAARTKEISNKSQPEHVMDVLLLPRGTFEARKAVFGYILRKNGDELRRLQFQTQTRILQRGFQISESSDKDGPVFPGLLRFIGRRWEHVEVAKDKLTGHVLQMAETDLRRSDILQVEGKWSEVDGKVTEVLEQPGSLHSETSSNAPEGAPIEKFTQVHLAPTLDPNKRRSVLRDLHFNTLRRLGAESGCRITSLDHETGSYLLVGPQVSIERATKLIHMWVDNMALRRGVEQAARDMELSRIITTGDVTQLPAERDDEDQDNSRRILQDSTTTTQGAEKLANDMRTVLRPLTHPVVLITTRAYPSTGYSPSYDEGLKLCRGVTVSSFTSVTLQPVPIVSFNLKLPSRTWDALRVSQQLCIHIFSATPEAAAITQAFAVPHDEPDGPFRVIQRLDAGVRLDRRWAHPPIVNKRGAIVARVLASLLVDKSIVVGDHVLITAEVKSVKIPGKHEDNSNIAKGMEDVDGLSYSKRAYRSLGAAIPVPELPAAPETPRKKPRSPPELQHDLKSLEEGYANVFLPLEKDSSPSLDRPADAAGFDLFRDLLEGFGQSMSSESAGIIEDDEEYDLGLAPPKLPGKEVKPTASKARPIASNAKPIESNAPITQQSTGRTLDTAKARRRFRQFGNMRHFSSTPVFRRSEQKRQADVSDLVSDKAILSHTIEEFLGHTGEQRSPQRIRALLKAKDAAARAARELQDALADGTLTSERSLKLEHTITVNERFVAKKLAVRSADELRRMLDTGKADLRRAQWLETAIEKGMVVYVEEARHVRLMYDEGKIDDETFLRAKQRLEREHGALNQEAARLRAMIDDDDGAFYGDSVV